MINAAALDPGAWHSHSAELAVMMPYILTILVLTLSVSKGRGPSALTKVLSGKDKIREMAQKPPPHKKGE